MDSIEFNPQILIATLIGVSLAGLWGGLTPNLLDQCPKSLQTGFTFFSSGSVLALLFGQVIPQLFYDIKQFHAPIPVELLCGMVIVFGKLTLQLVALLFPGSLGQISQKPSSANPNLWTTVEDPSDSNDDDTNELHYFLSPDHCKAPRPRQPPAMLVTISIITPLSTHAFLEGLVLGTQDSWRDVVAFGISLALHKWVVTLSLGSFLKQAKIQGLSYLLVLTIFVAMTPLGAIVARSVGNTAHESSLYPKLIRSYSAGILLHLAMVDQVGTFDNGIGTLGTTLGVASMFLLLVGLQIFLQ